MRENKGRGREREDLIFRLFIFQMEAMAGTGLGRSQELHLSLLCEWQGYKYLGQLPLLFKRH